MTSFVLDASAVIALLRGEPGADTVAQVVGSAAISAVNLQEVWKQLLDGGAAPDMARQIVDTLRLDVRPHDEDGAWNAAVLSSATRPAGSGLGDRSCMALAISERVPAMTADKAWEKVQATGLQVRLIR
jgi:PIN domain nuclease of toxin-antitoxin system